MHENPHFNYAMDAIRSFELKEMAYKFNLCSICHERRLEMKMASQDMCFRCAKEKTSIKIFSSDNNMDLKSVPYELQDLTIVEQQLLSRSSPAINIHMLKHGGIASSGHCVTFPQQINEPATVLPKLPSEINILKVKRKGKNDSSKEYRVRRYTVQNALLWLKNNNPAYSDITISNDRLNQLPIDSSVNLQTLEVDSFEQSSRKNDIGPAPNKLILVL